MTEIRLDRETQIRRMAVGRFLCLRPNEFLSRL